MQPSNWIDTTDPWDFLPTETPWVEGMGKSKWLLPTGNSEEAGERERELVREDSPGMNGEI